jgi:hypothetical protein
MSKTRALLSRLPEGYGRQAAVLLVLVLGLTAGWPVVAGAQSALGTIRGTAFDPQNAVVPGAAVLVTDEDTGVPRVTDTDARGNYEVVSLKPGRYRVEVSMSGFRTYSLPGIHLRASETVRVDARLELGGASETVSVSAASPNAIQLESQAVEASLEAQQLQNLPRVSRDMTSFLYLNSNVVGDGQGGFQFLGGRTYGSSYVQDGQPSTGGLFGSITNAAPGLDAIQEVKVLSNSYSAEYGGLAGVVVTSRRGGNAFHGSGFWDYNSNKLNALPYDQVLAGKTRDDPNSATSDSRYGATLGGPLFKKKTFFFANFDGSKATTIGGGKVRNVPTDAFRAGDFSAAAFSVTDPRTGLPFANNTIPANRIEPAATALLNFFYPHANLTPSVNSAGKITSGRYQKFSPLETTRERADLRVDHELTKNDSIFVRYSYQRRLPNNIFEIDGFPDLGMQDRSQSTQTVAANWNRILSGSLLNEFRAGYNSDKRNQTSTYSAADVTSRIGLQIPAGGENYPGWPTVTFQGSNVPFSLPASQYNRQMQQNFLSFSDTLSWLHGNHSFKAGGQFNLNDVKDGFSTFVSGSAGAYTFGGGQTGNSFGDFMLGLPSRSQVGVNMRQGRPLDAYSHEWSAFIQDDWKVSSRMTVFLGLRYEYLGNFIERNSLLLNFDPKTGGFILPDESTRSAVPTVANYLPQTIASQYNLSPSLVNPDTNNFSPRIGFAYRIGNNNKTVLRGGAGLFYPTAAAQGIRDFLSRSPFRYGIRRNNPLFAQGFTTGTPSTIASFGVNGVDTNLKSPQVWQYNVTLEREVGKDIGVRVSYIGSRLRGLLVNRDLNSLPPSTTPFDINDESQFSRLAYPALGPGYLTWVTNAGTGRFDALQIQGTKRFSKGLAFDVAYTWASSYGNAPDLGNSSMGVVQYNPYDLNMDLGPDPNVVNHRLVANATWEIPFGHNRAFGTKTPGWLDAVVGGWTVSTIFQARSGQHWTPYFAYGVDNAPANTGDLYDTNNSYSEMWRPDYIGTGDGCGGGGSSSAWFDVTQFKLPAPGTVGTAKKGCLTMPGAWVVNFGIYKTVFHRKGVSAEFRATIDNAFNNPQFYDDPSTGTGFLDLTDYLINGVRDNGVTGVLRNLNSPEGFGVSRVVRIGLKLTF